MNPVADRLAIVALTVIGGSARRIEALTETGFTGHNRWTLVKGGSLLKWRCCPRGSENDATEGGNGTSTVLRGIITREPGKMDGRPTVRGMRITVYDVLSYLAAGVSKDEVLEDFPYLTEEDILSCLAYAADQERRLSASGG